jgi:hypothetical protein
MRVAGLTASGDWRFGKGKAIYLRRSDAIRQNVVTRLRSFTDDWFLDTVAGLPWFELLGNRETERRILREVERTVLATEGVRAIERLRLIGPGRNREAVIEIDVVDIFDERFTERLTPEPI